MTLRHKRALLLAIAGLVPTIRTDAADLSPSVASSRVVQASLIPSVQPEPAPAPKPVEPLPVPTPADSTMFPPVASPGSIPHPAYSRSDQLPIDLTTVLRLVDQNSPLIGFAQARVRAAQARMDRAEVAWLPDILTGATYNRYDGQTQNQRGEVFGTSRSNLFASGGISLRWDPAEVYYAQLIAERLYSAEQQSAAQTTLDAQLDAALAYQDLVQVYGQLAVNADILEKAEIMLKFAQAAKEAALSKTAADVNRAWAEVYIRRQERIDLMSKVGATSARLARQLLLKPTVNLHPTDADVVPIVLVSELSSLDDIVALAMQNRPDLAAARDYVVAAQQAVRMTQVAPFVPRVFLDQQSGVLGGGINAYMGDFSARTQVNTGLVWEFRNLGCGDIYLTQERRADLDQALYRLTMVEAKVGAEVSESAKVAAAKYEQLDSARKAVSEATETYRKLKDSSFNMIGPRAQYDALEPLTAIQQLNQARLHFLSAVIDFNRAQFRLFAAMGYPVRQ